MQKLIYLTISLLVTFITLESFHNGLMKKDGAAPGYTGSPGDSLKNCTACHGGFAVKEEGWIKSNIPAGGYEPNQKYTITATNKEWGATRFGFEVSPQDISGAYLGKMLITDSVRTKFTGSEKYITYTENGVEGKDSLAWSFDWIAPPAGTGDVTFYGGFNSNYEGHKGGDQTYLSTLKIKEKGANGVSLSSKNVSVFTTFPNPANEVINISFDQKIQGNSLFEMTDMNGKPVALITNQNPKPGIAQFNTSSMAPGNYIINLKTDGRPVFRKITIVH